MSSSVVESHSVQSQFVSLTNSRDALRSEVEALEQQRRRWKEAVTYMRDLQVTLGIELQKAHATVGHYQKTKELFQRETNRFSQIITTERKQLQQTHTEYNTLKQQNTLQLEHHIQAMKEWNTDLEILIQKQQDMHLSNMLASKEGVQVLMEFAAKTQTENHTDTDTQQGLLLLEKTATMLQEALSKHEQEQTNYTLMEQKVQFWRDRATAIDPLFHAEAMETEFANESSDLVEMDILYEGTQDALVPDYL